MASGSFASTVTALFIVLPSLVRRLATRRSYVWEILNWVSLDLFLKYVYISHGLEYKIQLFRRPGLPAGGRHLTAAVRPLAAVGRSSVGGRCLAVNEARSDITFFAMVRSPI